MPTNTRTVAQLTELGATPAANDRVPIWDTSEEEYKYVEYDDLLGDGGLVTGGGTVDTQGFTLSFPASGIAALRSGSPVTGRVAQWADGNTVTNSTLAKTGAGVLTLSASGAFTLTIPATGTAALLATENVFTANQRINALVGVNKAPASGAQLDILSGAAGRSALRLDTAASPTQAPAIININGTARMVLFGGSGGGFVQNLPFNIPSVDMGSAFGNRVFIGRNNNSSTPSAGHVSLSSINNNAYQIWADNSGVLRIWTGDPTFANDGSGTIVGTQTSAAAAKDIDEALPDWRESINYIVEAVQSGALRSWKYKSGAYNNEHYPIGIVTDYAERYGQDKNRSLNIPVAIGDLMGAVVWLAERVAELEGKDG